MREMPKITQHVLQLLALVTATIVFLIVALLFPDSRYSAMIVALLGLVFVWQNVRSGHV